MSQNSQHGNRFTQTWQRQAAEAGHVPVLFPVVQYEGVAHSSGQLSEAGREGDLKC